VWIAEQLAAQAEREMLSDRALRRQLVEAERAFDAGELTLEEYEAIEDGLLERIEQLESDPPQEGVH